MLPRPPRPVPADTVCGNYALAVPDRAPGRLWVEEVAAGRRDISAHHLYNVLTEVFNEALVLDSEQRRVGADAPERFYSFEIRCRASGGRIR